MSAEWHFVKDFCKWLRDGADWVLAFWRLQSSGEENVWMNVPRGASSSYLEDGFTFPVTACWKSLPNGK